MIDMKKEIDVDGILVFNVREWRAAEIYRQGVNGGYKLTLAELINGIAAAQDDIRTLTRAVENNEILVRHYLKEGLNNE